MRRTGEGRQVWAGHPHESVDSVEVCKLQKTAGFLWYF